MLGGSTISASTGFAIRHDKKSIRAPRFTELPKKISQEWPERVPPRSTWETRAMSERTQQYPEKTAMIHLTAPRIYNENIKKSCETLRIVVLCLASGNSQYLRKNLKFDGWSVVMDVSARLSALLVNSL